MPWAKSSFLYIYGLYNPGHSDKLLEKYLDLLKSRKSNQGDVFIITGDLTKKGSESEIISFNDFYQTLKNFSERVFLVPGNHDYWAGKSFLLMFIVTSLCRIPVLKTVLNSRISRWLKISNSLDSFFKLGLLKEFENTSVVVDKLRIRGVDLDLVRVDSSYRNDSALAQGFFPLEEFIKVIEDGKLNKRHDLKILSLHHHLVDYLHDSESNVDYLLYEVGIRVTNSYKANKLLESQGFDFVLHGHKHQQDSKVYLAAKKYGVFLAAPALFLDRKDFKEKIGFNFILVGQVYIYTLEVGLKDNEYVCHKIERFKR